MNGSWSTFSVPGGNHSGRVLPRQKRGQYFHLKGLPGETLEDARTTLAFVQDLKVDMYYHNFLNVLDGTQLESEEEYYDFQKKRVVAELI